MPLVIQLTDDEKCLWRGLDIDEARRLAREVGGERGRGGEESGARGKKRGGEGRVEAARGDLDQRERKRWKATWRPHKAVDRVPNARTGACKCSPGCVCLLSSGQITLPGHGLCKGSTHP